MARVFNPWPRYSAAAIGTPDAQRSEATLPSNNKRSLRSFESAGVPADVVVYHAATTRKDGQVVTVGGRVLGVTALAANLDAAVARAYEVVNKLSFEGMFYRKDIGKKALARLHAPR